MDYSFPINPNPKPKLPIKRKTPHSSSTPLPNFLSPTLSAAAAADDDDSIAADGLGLASRPPPFKFHRIWTESDEIRFLRGLLDCSSQGLSFPRDLPVFHSRFSHSMSHPYSKSQLSDKLRRLRKKFRVLSSRIARGLDESSLSPHDRALYGLSKKLWSSHNLISGNKKGNDCDYECKDGVLIQSSGLSDDHDYDDREDDNVDCDFGQIGRDVARTALNVFDQCLEEVRMVRVRRQKSVMKYENRWQEQRIAELDTLARRLRLVLENSLCGS